MLQGGKRHPNRRNLQVPSFTMEYSAGMTILWARSPVMPKTYQRVGDWDSAIKRLRFEELVLFHVAAKLVPQGGEELVAEFILHRAS